MAELKSFLKNYPTPDLVTNIDESGERQTRSWGRTWVNDQGHTRMVGFTLMDMPDGNKRFGWNTKTFFGRDGKGTDIPDTDKIYPVDLGGPMAQLVRLDGDGNLVEKDMLKGALRVR
jgi:hypothetical protein